MKIVASEKWIPCDGVVLEDNANAAVKAKGNVLVVAGPGAGKTELLAQKASYLFQTNICRDPQKILAISFKNDAADNLKKRVIKRCGKEVESRFISMTYDAFSKSLVDHFRFALPESIRPESSYLVNDADIIDAAFKKAGYNNPQRLPAYKLRTYYDSVLGNVQLPYTKNDLGERVWGLLLKGFDDYKPTLSFKMISILSEYIIRTNPKIKRGLQLTYKYVFLDEFQDTTGLQYGLVKQCFLNSNSIMTAVGDNKQRIMVWAGALKTVFDDYKREFNAETKKLIMNHRSAPRLVDLQRKMYASLNEEDSAICVSDKWKPEDGTITLFIAKDDEQEATALSKQIASKIKSGLEPNRICILCKQKPANYTERIIDELKKLQIYARVEDDYQNLIKEPIVEMLISILRLAVDIKHPHDWEYVVLKTSELWNVASYQSDDDYLKMQEALDAEIELLGSMMKNVASKREFQELLKHAIEFWGGNRIKANFPVYGQGTYLKEVLTKFKDYMWNELETTEKDWLLAIENFEGLHSVPIMTIHKSKGLEYDVVYFVGLEDSAFWSFKNQPEEDRCAFFVALSRAKKEIFFTFCQYRYMSKFPKQKHDDINEFFELLKIPGMAKIIE
ncbi:DNA helicase UvrD [Anaerostipes sp. 992a]|uniref:UvrD-helicase domain-containing protein n=1 Tax=Anaerostipes sp. 992a TaxID=1261637 RepID=UPI0009520CB7|nr:ATP-dependent helicase [Anaerostipes sp. 992a]OLR62317.1 DNA helicase UvrD [Anaerostipes sp. 992a]